MRPIEEAVPKKCHQCGLPTDPLNLDEKATESGWFTCQRCGERIISISDAVGIVRREQEQAVRDKLGVDEFLGARGIDKRV